MEGDQEMTGILNSVKKCWIRTLSQIVSIWNANWQQAGDVLTLTKDSTLRRPGAAIGTIPIMLNTSTQNNGYSPSKNSLKLPNTNTR